MSEAELSLSPTPSAPADRAARARKETTVTLFAVALLFLVGALLAVVTPKLLGMPADPAWLAKALAWTVGPAAVFAGLALWARSRPLPAVVVGLLLYVGGAVTNAVRAPEQLGKGTVVQLVMAALLVRAVWVCLKARPHGGP
jgi:hypothetical protein